MSETNFRRATDAEIAALKEEHGPLIYGIDVGVKIKALGPDAQVIFRHMNRMDRAYLKQLTERADANADEMIAQRLVIYPDVGTYNEMADIAYGIHSTVGSQAMVLYGYVEHEAAKKL